MRCLVREMQVRRRCCDCATLSDLEDLVVCFNFSSSRPFRTTIQSAKLSSSSSQRNGLDCPFWFRGGKKRRKRRIQGTIYCKILCNFGTASNGFWVMRSHCRDCLLTWPTKRLPFCLKRYIQRWWGEEKKKKHDEKSKWLHGLLNHKSNVIVRAAPLSSRHQILLLALIENPWGPL